MNFLKKHYSAVYSFYKKTLFKKLKKNFNKATCELSTWILYLQYIRDYYILKSTEVDVSTDPLIASISTALMEYTQANTCIFKYFKWIKENGITKLVPVDEILTEDEAQKLYQQEQNSHWDKFWKIVNQYILLWNNGITI